MEFQSTGHYFNSEDIPENRMEKLVKDPANAGKHLWVMMTVFQVDPRVVMKGDSYLDQENIIDISGPGCTKCGLHILQANDIDSACPETFKDRLT